MSSLFDIYIRGINPDRLDEADKIKQKACKALQIELPQLEVFLSTPGGKCILRGAEEETAKQYQAALSKAGLICVYTPSKGAASFSLVPVEEEAEAPRTFICPNCGNEMPVEGKEEHPEKCDKCFITIGKFLLIKQQDEEREALKKRLLSQQSTKKSMEAELQEKEQEEKRRKALEKEILNEILTEEERRAKKIRIIAGSAAGFVAAIGFGIYLYISITDKHKKEHEAELRRVSGQSITIAADGVSLNQALINSAQNAPIAEFEGTEGQQSLREGYNKANKALNAFGLDAGAMAARVGAGGAGGTSGAASASDGGVPAGAAQAGATQTPAPAPVKEPTPAEQSGALLLASDNTQEWDLFLSKSIASLEARLSSVNGLRDALQLSKYIVDDEVYVDTIGQLLAAAQQVKQSQLVSDILFSLESRITALPVEEQAAFFAQAGFYQSRVLGQNSLFTRADTQWKQIISPVSKLKSALKIAVAYYKAGNVDVSNGYFNQTNTMLENVSLPNEQVILRAAIGRAYNEVNNPVNATEWLVSADSLLTQVTQDTLQYLIDSYAFNNQFQSAIDVATKYGAKSKQDELLYSAVKASLKVNSISNAMAISKEIKDPAYNALAADLIASYDLASATVLMESGEKLLESMTYPVDKAIVNMRLARHYARIGNQIKAEELFAHAEQQISGMPASRFKDDVFASLAKNYAEALQGDAAAKSVAAIVSVDIKTRLNKEIQSLSEVGPLLSGS